jgi:acetyltransferase-like isoleucine patch superfamily enzyme
MILRYIIVYKARLLHLCVEETSQFVFGALPGSLGMLFRGLTYKLFVRSKGLFLVWPRVSLQHTYGLSVGRKCSINSGAVIDARGGIVMGNDVMIGPNAVVVSSNHDLSAVPMNSRKHINCETIIGDDVWIGAGSIICAGVRVGSGCVIGAGSVVTRDVAPYEIVAGVPAVKIRDRLPK